MASIWKRLDNEWFYTRLAATLFATSAIIVVALLAVDQFFPSAFGNASNYSPQEEVTFTAAMMLFAMSNLVIVVGMLRFWVVSDTFRPAARRVWFVIMIVGLLRLGLGAAIYCFAVYLPQVSKRFTQRSETSGS